MRSNNEVLAREGIDTGRALPIKTMALQCNNEVLAREGIDTVNVVVSMINIGYTVTMRY